jgi:tetratricopeptide (TPR) repeat protein
MRKLRRKQLKEDKFVESMLSAQLFFSRHVRLLMLFGIAAAAVVAFFTMVMAHRGSMDRKASSIFQHASGAAAYLELYHAYPRSTVAPLALYEGAKALYVDGRYDESSENYRLFLKHYPQHPLAPDALNSIGYCLEAGGKTLDAAGVYVEAADKYAKAAVAPEALINSARCYRLAGKAGEAEEQYRRVIRDYPGSIRRLDAERYLAALESGGEGLDRAASGE